MKKSNDLQKEIANFNAKKTKKEIEKSSNYQPSKNAYWDFLKIKPFNSIKITKHDNNFTEEPTLANPNNLTDELHNKPWGNNPPKLARLLIDEYMNEDGEFAILSEQENIALRLYTSGLSLSEVAKEMKVSKSTIVTYIGRASVKFRKLLKSVEGEICQD